MFIFFLFSFFFLFFLFFFFFLFSFFFFLPATILSGPYLWNHYSQRLQIECAAWSCGLILHCCLPSNSLRYFFYFLFFLILIFFPATIFLFIYFFLFIYLFNFFFLFFFFSLIFFFSPTTILSGPFASLISSLINIISLLLTTFDWTKVRGIAPRSHTGRPRTCLVF